jgi:hypothetical protein
MDLFNNSAWTWPDLVEGRWFRQNFGVSGSTELADVSVEPSTNVTTIY